jgi:hypothetical protein
MPDLWVGDLAIAGTPEECAQEILSFYAAVALLPVATDRMVEVVRLAPNSVLPRLS